MNAKQASGNYVKLQFFCLWLYGFQIQEGFGNQRGKARSSAAQSETDFLSTTLAFHLYSEPAMLREPDVWADAKLTRSQI
jgi:hypothetical protein